MSVVDLAGDVVAQCSSTGDWEGRAEPRQEPCALTIEGRSAAVETVNREKASFDPGSVGSPLAVIGVEMRAKPYHDSRKDGDGCLRHSSVATSSA
ncbi:uncharacterized protein PFL1_06947 [Pseudozyma flocculosa PF-1]|uniref:uncharacterized protein n=1 Tax=Pseudozyma flocculosa PF-1 TaxID=1277687 RepID=UPI0004560511|nr:uncharacterized protein PFL1_06947 [Pseudozyma flocculosa PF-1]EPQ30037.1 hypothetical protein PFL1_06947 [Pseudozyma flocculosa PF-1]